MSVSSVTASRYSILLIVVIILVVYITSSLKLGGSDDPAAQRPQIVRHNMAKKHHGKRTSARSRNVRVIPNGAAEALVPESTDSPVPPTAPQLPPPSIDASKYTHELNTSLEWVVQNAPHFECSDADISQAYWYRWRVFHLHTVRTDEGYYVITEFLPKVFWSGPHNTISCPAGHHVMEGRWLRDAAVVQDYAKFWFTYKPVNAEDKKTWERMYTFWAASSAYNAFLVSGNTAFIRDLYPYLEKNYEAWKASHYSEQGACMFQACHADGEENSCGLDGCRPTINAVMYGEAAALVRIAALANDTAKEAYFTAEAARWQEVLLGKLWSEELGFFVTYTVPPPAGLIRELHAQRLITYFGCLACDPARSCPPVHGWPVDQRVPVRELMGLSSPWYHGAIPRTQAAVDKYAAAFAELRDPAGFHGAWGPRTCERRHDCYNFTNSAQCNWNGGSWPYETSKVLTGLANLLQQYPAQAHVAPRDFQDLLQIYARGHTRSSAAGPEPPPHVDEDLHPDEGWWITRRKLWANPHDPLKDRGQHYFHSSFNDVVLTGLCGLVPPDPAQQARGVLVVVKPLVDPTSGGVAWFAVRGVPWRGHVVDVVYDWKGEKYDIGAGVHVWLDGTRVVAGKSIGETPIEVYPL